MMRRLTGFNHFLAACFLLAALCACETTSSGKKNPKKDATLLRLHIEATPDPREHTVKILALRATPIELTINTTPFLDEANILKASVMDVVGGFAIRLEYDHQGALILDNYTSTMRGRRIVVFSKWTEDRWLAAPMINKRVTDGVVTFTPDATREERSVSSGA